MQALRAQTRQISITVKNRQGQKTKIKHFYFQSLEHANFNNITTPQFVRFAVSAGSLKYYYTSDVLGYKYLTFTVIT